MSRGRRGSPRRVAERELDALLVTDLVNVRYLTGFTGPNGAGGRRAARRARFLTDFRYVDAGRPSEVPDECARGCAGSDLLGGAGPSGWPDGRGAARLRRRARVASGAHAQLREAAPDGSSWSPPAGWSRTCARSRTTARSRASAPPRSSPTRR